MCVRERMKTCRLGTSIGEASGFWHLLIDREITWFQFVAQEQLCSLSLHAGEWPCTALGWPGACGCIGYLCLAWLCKSKQQAG